jgi:uncharacterized protein YkwD
VGVRHLLLLALIVLAAGCPASSTSVAPAGPSPSPGPDPRPNPNPSPSPDPSAGVAADPIAAALLAEHNTVRARHCAAPLAWSPRLAAVAQRWAEHLRDDGCGFDHSDSPYGENLAAGEGTLDAAAVVGMWAEEERAYDFGRGGFSMDTGHFTQVVWRDTTAVGCGRTACNGLDLWVCNYDPPGNVAGGHRANVSPPRC